MGLVIVSINLKGFSHFRDTVLGVTVRAFAERFGWRCLELFHVLVLV